MCESTFSLGHGDPYWSLCGVSNMLLDSVGANGTHHHYVYIRCDMFQWIKFDDEKFIVLNLFSSHTLAVSQSTS